MSTLGGPGYQLVEKARDTINKYRMTEPGDSVLVAVSGGPDSTCLLDVLVRLAATLDIKLEVAHVDHGLSDESEAISAEVTSRAAQAGHEVHFVTAPDLAGSNLQARARDFRYAFLETVATNAGFQRVATGHTLDDRAETTVARLIHGAGTRGLAGLLPVEGLRIRPLIEIRRAEARAYCVERGLEFYDDPANEDDRFERVAVRKRIIAAIEERWGSGAVHAVAVSAERLGEDAEAIEGLATAVYGQIASRDGDGVRFDREAFLRTPRAFRRRLLETAIGRVRDRSGGIDESLDALDRDATFIGRFSAAGGAEIVVTSDSIMVKGAAEDASESGTTLDR